MGIYGQDWASYQSDAPDTSGLGFVFIKVTEGLTYVNPHWEAQRAHAHAKGLVVGLYHYPHMGNPAADEAARFLAVARPRPGEVLCLDWEGYDPANQGVSRTVQAAYKDAFLRRAAAAAPGNRLGTYCNTDYLRDVDASGKFGDFLWIATAGRPAGSPGIRAPWLFHQYSAAGVDRDFCSLPTVAALAAWANLTTPEEDMFSDTDAQHAGEAAARIILGTEVPVVPDANGTRSVSAVLGRTENMVRELRGQATAQAVQVTGLSAAVAALAAQLGKGGDVATIVTAVQDAIAHAVIHVEVGSVPAP